MDITKLKRISYLASFCRTNNEQPELSSMLRELDSSIEEIIDNVKNDYPNSALSAYQDVVKKYNKIEEASEFWAYIKSKSITK